mmetsp:Transcript_2942/g.11925  ORF Transcript_2942/g.11925 Transcript_2942/m.11925 type:complete len:627 (-) Transcript_2942:169-2049(-)
MVWRILWLLGALATSIGQETCYLQSLQERCLDLLSENLVESVGWTVPSNKSADIYMDATTSLVVSLTWGYADEEAAWREFEAVLAGQWTSGLIPAQQVPLGDDSNFIEGTVYAGPGLWDTAGLSPAGKMTAGFSGLPLHGHVALQLYNLGRQDEGAEARLQDSADKLFKYFKFLFDHRAATARDFEGLILSTHPWELPIPVESPFIAEAMAPTISAMKAAGYSPPAVPKSVKNAPNYPDNDDIYNAMLFQLDCLARQAYGEVHGCPFALVDPLYNAVLLRSVRALEQIIDVLDELRLSTGSAGSNRDEVRRWSDSLVEGLQRLFDYSIGTYKAFIKTSGADSYGALDTVQFAVHYATLYGYDGSGCTEALAGTRELSDLLENLVYAEKPGSFQCGEYYLASDAACDAYNAVSNAILWMPSLYFAQRGLIYVGETGTAASIQRQGIASACRIAPWDNFDTDMAHSSSINSRNDTTPNFVRVAYADNSKYPDEQAADSSMAAAVSYLLTVEDGANTRTDSPPISHELTFTLMVIELVIAFGIGVTCFVFSTNLIRRLQKSEKEIPFALGEGDPLVGPHYSDERKDSMGDIPLAGRESQEEPDVEESEPQDPGELGAMLQTYTPYLRLW